MYSKIENGVLIEFDERDLINGHFDIPNGVKSIGYYAFAHCSNLTSITIPDSVTSIEDSAFHNCSSLISVALGSSITSIEYNAFSGCSSLTSLTIPDKVENIGYGAFEGCIRLTTITIPDGVKSIGYRVFADCSSLTSVTIPNSVTSIGDGTFRDCFSLTSVTIPNSVTSIGVSCFAGCSRLASLTIPDKVENIGYEAFEGCIRLTTITIPDGVKSIGYRVFADCSSLTSVTIPNSVTSIGGNCFTGCSNLTSITIPDGVKSIGDSAFSYCRNLTSITIPDSVTSIGSSAFSYCSNLTSITIHDRVKSIGDRAFAHCSSLTSITIPNEVKSIGYYAFAHCSRLTSITIPKSVMSIGSSCFADCCDLTSLTIPKRLVKDLKFVPPFTLIKTEDGEENYLGLINSGITGKVNTSKINRIMNNPTFKGQNTDDFFNLLLNLGLFEDKKSKITMHNDQGKEIEQPTSDVGFNILQKLFKEDVGLSADDMHSYFQSMRPVGANEAFLRFMSNKTNLNEIIEREKKQNGFIARVLDWFETRKSLNNLQQIEDSANMTTTPTSEENRYKVRTYSTAESGIDKIKWQTPTVALLAKEFKENKFTNVTKETKHIADFLGDYDLYEQKHFDKAVELDKERQEKGVPDHILGEELKQSYTDSLKEYLEKTETLKKEILNQAGKTLKSQADIADEVFTYEMLSKSDNANFVMGFFTSCCATLYGAGAGAMRAMIVDNRMQPIVIRDRKDEIVAFGILYVNKGKGYAVVNNIEVNIRYQYGDKARKAIYDKLMQGIEAFVVKYNEKFAKPIKCVHCGISPNWLAINDYIKENPKGKILEAPDFNDYKYAGSGSWSGDWHKEQYVLWQEKGKGV